MRSLSPIGRVLRHVVEVTIIATKRKNAKIRIQTMIGDIQDKVRRDGTIEYGIIVRINPLSCAYGGEFQVQRMVNVR